MAPSEVLPPEPAEVFGVETAREAPPVALALRGYIASLYGPEEEQLLRGELRQRFTAVWLWLLVVALSGALLGLERAGILVPPSGCPVSFPRLLPLHTGAALFGLLGNLAFALWRELLPRLTGHRPAEPRWVRFSFFFWNLGCAYGALAVLFPAPAGFQGVFLGVQTPVPGYEFPLLADLMLAVAAGIVAARVLTAIHLNREFRGYGALWFAAAAAIWLLLLLLLGNLFVVALPAALGEAAAAFCREGLVWLWALPAALSLAVYAAPRAVSTERVKRPLASRSLLLLGFWGYVVVAPLMLIDPAALATTGWSCALAAGARTWLLAPGAALLLVLLRTLLAPVRSGADEGTVDDAATTLLGLNEHPARRPLLYGTAAFGIFLLLALVDLDGRLHQALRLTSLRAAEIHLLAGGAALLWGLGALLDVLEGLAPPELVAPVGRRVRFLALGLALLVLGLALEGFFHGHLRARGLGFEMLAEQTWPARLFVAGAGLLALFGALRLAVALRRALRSARLDAEGTLAIPRPKEFATEIIALPDLLAEEAPFQPSDAATASPSPLPPQTEILPAPGATPDAAPPPTPPAEPPEQEDPE